MVGPAVRRLVIARDPDNVGANLGRQTAFDVAGFVLGPLIAAVFAQLLGLRAPFVVLAILYVVAFALVGRIPFGDTGVAGDGHRAIRNLVRLPAVQSALLAAIAFYLTLGMFEALWSVLLRDLGAETWLIGLTLSIFTIPMIIFAPRGGALAQTRGPIMVVTSSILVAAACTFVYGIGPLWLLIVVSGIHAVADAYTMPANQVAVAMASPPDQIATGQGLLGATGLAVAGLSAVVGAAVYDTFGRGAVFTGTAVLMVILVGAARWRWNASPPVGLEASQPKPLPTDQ
jgi:DHA1 family multidrug resistance protein-like MFS transporter